MKDEAKIEKEIQEKGLNAPRITPEDIDSTIVSEQYHVFPNTTFTVCLLTCVTAIQFAVSLHVQARQTSTQRSGERLRERMREIKSGSLKGICCVNDCITVN